MALTQTTLVDINGGTQTITFSDPSQIDQITFSSNQITFQLISSFNLSKSDMALYSQFIITYNNLLYYNFPSIASSVNLAWPLCEFDITESSSGVTHLYYTQQSQGTQVTQIDYVPIAVSGSFAARASPVTISLQEWFMTVNMLTQYFKQISLN